MLVRFCNNPLTDFSTPLALILVGKITWPSPFFTIGCVTASRMNANYYHHFYFKTWKWNKFDLSTDLVFHEGSTKMEKGVYLWRFTNCGLPGTTSDIDLVFDFFT